MTKDLENILSAYRYYINKENRLNEQIEELETRLMPSAIRYDKDKVQTSPSDPMLKVAADIADLQKELDSVMEKKIDAYRTASSLICKLDDGTEKGQLMCIMMTKKWIRGRSWEQISRDVRYSKQRCFQLNAEAVCILEKEVNVCR